MGDYPVARQYCEEALEISQKVLGKEHPDTASNLHNLALLYYYESNFQEAAKLMRKSLAISRKAFGESHPNTKSSMKSLADIEKCLH